MTKIKTLYDNEWFCAGYGYYSGYGYEDGSVHGCGDDLTCGSKYGYCESNDCEENVNMGRKNGFIKGSGKCYSWGETKDGECVSNKAFEYYEDEDGYYGWDDDY